MTASRWNVPALWAGETVVIIGSGPSLDIHQLAKVNSAGIRSIAINNNYQAAPWADLHYFCDRRWHDWHKGDSAYLRFPGIRCTLENYELEWPNLHHVHNYGDAGVSTLRDGVMTGRNSGYQCMNLALHLGVKRILLLGFDMQRNSDGQSHWHGGHPTPQPEGVFDKMLRHFPAMAEHCKRAGVEIINCTPGSALECFEKASIDACL